MPVARYFLFVGGVLLALLFISDAFVPKVSFVDATDPGIDKPIIRIHSDRKWPERIIYDTSLPTIIPPPVMRAEARVPLPGSSTPADVSAKSGVREAFAQVPSSDATQSASSDLKKAEPKPQRKRKIARSHLGPPRMLFAQQPRFGFFDYGAW
jgi:hypothetical protein